MATIPHIWTDPTMIGAALDPLADRAGELDGVDAAAVVRSAAAYERTLADLDAEIAALLAPIPDGRRTLVTNHEALGYFAEQYDLGSSAPSSRR